MIFLVLILSLPASGRPAISIQGNDFLSSREIRRLLAPPEKPQDLSESEVRQWAEEAQFRLRDRYAQSGFFDTEINLRLGPVDPNAETSPWLAAMEVREGPRYRFGQVTIVLPDDAPALIRSEALEARPDLEFERDALLRDRRRIERIYANSGFVHVRVIERRTLLRDSSRVEVVYQVEPGRAVVFDTLIIRNSRSSSGDTLAGVVDHDLVYSLLDMSPGDTVRARQLDRYSDKLRSTGAFTFVRVRDTLLSDTASRSAIVVSMAERVPGNLNTSAFFETGIGFGIDGRIAHRNIGGRFHEARTGFSLAQRRQSLFGGYGTPLFLNMQLRFDNDISAEWTQEAFQRELYDQGLYQGNLNLVNSPAFSRSFFYWLRLRSGGEFIWDDLLDSAGVRTKAANLNALNTVFITFLDQVLDPTRGMRLSFTWGNGGPLYRREKVSLLDRHNWFEAQTAWYLPLLSTVRMAARLDGGAFFGADKVNSRRFYLGGPRNVRSFGFQSLCPVKTLSPMQAVEIDRCSERDIEPVFALASLEFRLAVFRWMLDDGPGWRQHLRSMHIVPFVDYGLVWERSQSPEFNALRSLLPGSRERTRAADNFYYGEGVAMGMGLRYPLLGIFNLRTDFARGPDAYGVMRWNWALDLAQAF